MSARELPGYLKVVETDLLLADKDPVAEWVIDVHAPAMLSALQELEQLVSRTLGLMNEFAGPWEEYDDGYRDALEDVMDAVERGMMKEQA